MGKNDSREAVAAQAFSTAVFREHTRDKADMIVPSPDRDPNCLDRQGHDYFLLRRSDSVATWAWS